jgi:hypothetical protein
VEAWRLDPSLPFEKQSKRNQNARGWRLKTFKRNQDLRKIMRALVRDLTSQQPPHWQIKNRKIHRRN